MLKSKRIARVDYCYTVFHDFECHSRCTLDALNGIQIKFQYFVGVLVIFWDDRWKAFALVENRLDFI